MACLTNEPASKRAVIGSGTYLPAPVAVVLARLIDRAVPARESIAKRCAPANPSVLTRFGYPSQPVDVVLSTGCRDGAVAYVHGRGYLLPSLLAGYLQGTTDTSGSRLVPDVMGVSLTRAVARSRQAGDTVELDGELVDDSAAGTVLLQYPTVVRQIAVIAAVHRSPACRAGQLAIQYLPGGAGMGSDFGTIVLRNTSTAWCEMDGPLTVTGVTSGHRVTRTARPTVGNDLELSPGAAADVPGSALRPDQLVASASLSAEYRDDRDGSQCNPHWIVPATWRVTIASTTLTVPNGRATSDPRRPGSGGLITCRGWFGASSVQIATS